MVWSHFGPGGGGGTIFDNYVMDYYAMLHTKFQAPKTSVS